MGFSIGVSSTRADSNYDCYNFIDRAFYDFVNSGEMYGDKSILIQCGKYYKLDLSPLLKLVYTWNEVSEDYIQENIQNTDFILDLVTTFQNRIKDDKSVCDKIEYVWYESSADKSDNDIQKLIEGVWMDTASPFIDMREQQKKEIEENQNPWQWYFEDGQIIKDLENIIKSIKCYKEKGITEVYFTAG